MAAMAYYSVMKNLALVAAAVLLAPAATVASAQTSSGVAQEAAPAAKSAPAPAADAAAAEDPQNKIKCRTASVIGSLAKKVRICKTVAEWQRSRVRGSEAAREVADYSRGGQLSN